MFSFKALLVLNFPCFVEMELISEVSKVAVPDTTNKMAIPEVITLDVITDAATFTFDLRRNGWHNRNIPVITGTGNKLQSYNHDLQKTGVGIYGGEGSSFALKFKNGTLVTCKGFFHKDNHVYRVYPRNINSTLHIIYREPQQDWEFPKQDSHTDFDFFHHMTNIKTRMKRQTQLYEIELLIVVDNALFTQLAASIGITEADASYRLEDTIEDITHQFSIIVNGIDARFQGIKSSSYVIRVTIAGLYIAQDKGASPWSESILEYSNSREVVSEKSVKLFTNWVKVHQHNLPEFDHAMAFTAYNLRKEGNFKTLGLGYTQSMCTDRRFSIVEHHGDIAYVSYIATHELAHSLGAKHDGYPATVVYGDIEKTCGADEGYIMCPKASKDQDGQRKRWRFSECSVLYFDFFLDYLNENKTNCLTQRSSSHGKQGSFLSIESESYAYSPDEQCERQHGSGSVLDRKEISKNTSSICQTIPCTNQGDIGATISTLPVEGTICGHDKACHFGQCVDADTNLRYLRNSNDDLCIFGDQPGFIAETGLTCKELLNVPNFAYKCYTYDKQCCQSCYWYRRQVSVVEQTCQYGDKKEQCSDIECGHTDLCCETCAILSGKLKKCPVLNSPNQGFVVFNTKSNCFGTVAMFSCRHGYHVNGNKTANCLQDGNWDSTVSICTQGCPLPKLPPQVIMENDYGDGIFVIGSKVKIKCQNGFVLDSNAMIECRDDSTWSDVPNCILEFTSPEVVIVLENLPSASVVHYLTTGNVTSSFKLLYYSVSGFKVTTDGAVVVNEDYTIDFENVQRYSLIVEATSSVDERFKVRQRLEILVQDVNELKPTFQSEKYCVFLEEPYTDGKDVYKLSATDRDASNLNISYYIRNSEAELSDIFRIDTETGIIKISNEDLLNASENIIFTIQVEAVDTGSPQMTGTCVVQVQMDENCPQNVAAGSNIVTAEMYIAIVYIILYNVYVFHLLFKRNITR